jgi:hypothetical protein
MVDPITEKVKDDRKQVPLRIMPALYERIAGEAALRNISANSLICTALERAFTSPGPTYIHRDRVIGYITQTIGLAVDTYGWRVDGQFVKDRLIQFIEADE